MASNPTYWYGWATSPFDAELYWRELVSSQSVLEPRLQDFELASSHLLNAVHAFRNGDIYGYLIALDATLRRASSAICKLINGSRPINRLPAEIMEMIFSAIPRKVALVDSRLGAHWPFRAVLDISYLKTLRLVCHHWHVLVSGTPLLWSAYRETKDGPVGRSASWFATRSPSASIDVYAPGSFSTDLEKLLREQGHRIRQVQVWPGLRIDRSTSERWLSSLAALDFENLEHCSLVIHPDGARGLLSPLFTPRTAATLKSLAISSRSIVCAQQFPSLTRLVITHSVHTSAKYDIAHLTDVLSGAPRLEVLHLYGVNLGVCEESRLPHVVLGRLRYLSYEQAMIPLSTCTTFLSSLHLPAHCRVYLDNIIFQTLSASDNSALMRSLPAPHPPTQMSLFLRSAPPGVHGSTKEEGRLELPCTTTGGRGGTCIVLTTPPRGHSLEANCLWGADSPIAPAVLQSLTEARISVTGDMERGAAHIAAVLPMLENVRKLAVCFRWSWTDAIRTVIELRRALEPLGFLGVIPGQAAPACPALEELELYVPDTNDTLMDVLALLLQSRAENNVRGVRRLVVYYTGTQLRARSHTFVPADHVSDYSAVQSCTEAAEWDEWPRRAEEGGADERIGARWTTW
ncbi:hypothetical protein C8Q80DRAFT_1116872 [Daedaleopsis nitida]|nr:hypothetical protein C8Q80DRAFT_1116872 [Daedaleopsis nitida]